MAKWFKDYLSFGSRRSPPQPPKPDYTESEILKAYRAQKSLDFEDPYEDGEGKADPDPGGSPNKGSVCGGNLEGKYGSPKHRLIKVDASDLNRSKALLASAAEEAAAPLEQAPGESEYSDPFDAHREPKGDAEEDVELENNGYMEPYDAQKVVADLQRKSEWDEQRVKKSRIGLQLYDTPYEEKEAEADPETAPTDKPPKSRLPQEDERPADEYDQPWEWKKNHISRAFAVDIKETKVLPWPPPVGQLTGTEEPLDPEVRNPRVGPDLLLLLLLVLGPQRAPAASAEAPDGVRQVWPVAEPRVRRPPGRARRSVAAPGEPGEQPKFHAYEVHPNKGQQVRSGPKQRPFRQRPRGHPSLHSPRTAHQGGRTSFFAVPGGGSDAVVPAGWRPRSCSGSKESALVIVPTGEGVLRAG
ncbi:SH2 domain-containing adapter protein D isoform 3-T4 [Liasis olivaceus]